MRSLRARLFALERLAREHQALQGRGRAGFRVAQRRQRCGGDRLAALTASACAPVRSATVRDGDVAALLGVGDALGLRVDEAQMEQRRLGLADLLRDGRDSAPPGAPGA